MSGSSRPAAASVWPFGQGAWIRVAALCVASAIAACCLVQAAYGAKATANRTITPKAVAHVAVAPVRLQKLAATITGFGRVQAQPAKVVSIDAPRAATIGKVFVRPGQAVAQGNPIAQLTTSPATQEAFRKAQSAFKFAQGKLQRTQYLLKKGAATKVALDQAEVSYRAAKASLDAEKQTGAQQGQQTLTAPTAGTVTTVSVVEGDRVSQNAKIVSMTPSNALAVLLGVEPEDVGKLRIGMPVALTAAFDPSRQYSGKISALNHVIDQKTRLVDVIVDLESGGDQAALIGTEMRGESQLPQQPTLAVPRTAVLYDRRGAYVFIIRNDQAHRVDVTPGLQSGSQIGIKGSVKAGNTVVVQGNYELKEGMKVERVAHAVP